MRTELQICCAYSSSTFHGICQTSGGETVAAVFIPLGRMGRRTGEACFSRGLWVGNLHHQELKLEGFDYVSSSSSASDDVITLCKQGELDWALDVLRLVERKSTVSWAVDRYKIVLRECVKRKALAQANRVHSHLVKHGLKTLSLLGDQVVNTLVKCGGLKDALRVHFHRLSRRTVLSWTAVISGHTMSCQYEQALSLYEVMQQEGVQPNAYTFITLLKACGCLGNLEKGKRIHCEVLRFNCDSDAFVSTCLIDMYGKCGSIMDARSVFDALPELNVVSCNVMLAVYAQQSQAEETLQLYELMCEEGLSADGRTFVSVLQACGILADKGGGWAKGQPPFAARPLQKGKSVHASAQKMGHASNSFVASALISMYKKCGSVVDAHCVFDNLSHRDVVSWTAMLMAYVEQGQPEEALQLYAQMRVEGVRPDNWTFVSVLQACSIFAEKEDAVEVAGVVLKVRSLDIGKGIHADTWKVGYAPHGGYVGNTLVSMYAKCGSAMDVQNVFDGLTQCDVVSWTAMLSAQMELGRAQDVLELYARMREEGVSPNDRSFLSLLQACGMLAEQEEAEHLEWGGQQQTWIKMKSLDRARALHCEIWRRGYRSDVYICSSLVSVYGKCGSIMDAKHVFSNELASVALWNAMLNVLVQQGEPDEALQLYDRMCNEGVSRDARTFVSILQACSAVAEEEEYVVVDGQELKAAALRRGKVVHDDARSLLGVGGGGAVDDVEEEAFLGSALVGMYWRCGAMGDAQNAFDELSSRDVVVWNVILAAHVDVGQVERAWQLYAEMQLEGVNPNDRTFMTVLQACAVLADDLKRDHDGEAAVAMVSKQATALLRKGKGVHSDAMRKGYGWDVGVGSALIAMYGKCGSLVDAQDVFDRSGRQDVRLWIAMLSAYVQQGQPRKALELYAQMREQQLVVEPSGRTLVVALQACGMMADGVGAAWEQQQQQQQQQQLTKQQILEVGRGIHRDAQRRGLETEDVFVGNTLVSMYGKCGSVVDAQQVFDRMSHRDLVSWNALFAAFVQQHGGGGGGSSAKAVLQLYKQMREEGIHVPDACTFVSLVQACGMIAEEEEEAGTEEFVVAVPAGGGGGGGFTTTSKFSKAFALEQGKAVHDDIKRMGFAADVFVCNTLISMYGKCGAIADAQSVFDGLARRDSVSWSALIAAYVEVGRARTALQLFEQMPEAGVKPDDRTCVTALQACGILAEDVTSATSSSSGTLAEQRKMMLAKGKEMHEYVKRAGYGSDAFICNTLISMYGKCGSMRDAQEVFAGMGRSKRGVVSWNALLTGYLQQQQAQQHASQDHKVLQLYRQMQEEGGGGTSPDAVTLVCVLQAGSSTGGLDTCRDIHQRLARSATGSLSSAGGAASRFVATALIHAYGRCGSMADAQTVFDSLAQPDVAAWNALISGYARQGDWAAAFQRYQDMTAKPAHRRPQPDGVTYLALLTACSHAGLLDEGVELFESMVSSSSGVATPAMEHYACMVDLLGRAGQFGKVQALLDAVPGQPDLAMWLCLMGACRKHGEVAMARHAFERAVRAHPEHAAAYLLMAGVYADAGMWDCVREVKAMRQRHGAWKWPGRSWVEGCRQGVHGFVVGDAVAQPQVYGLVALLQQHMLAEGG